MRAGRRSRWVWLSVLGIAWLLAGPPVRAENVSRIYTPANRSAESLAEIARATLGEAGSVTLDGDALLLVGPRDAVARASEILEARDLPLPTFLVTVESRTVRSLRTAERTIRWVGGGDRLDVGTVKSEEPDARRAGAGRVYASGRDRSEARVLRVLQGETARFDLHEIVTLPARGYWGGPTQVVSHPSGLEVTPVQHASGRISVELAWSDATVSRRGDAAVARRGDAVVEQVSTSVEIEPDESVVIAGRARRGRSQSGLRAGRDVVRDADELLLLLRVSVVSPLQ